MSVNTVPELSRLAPQSGYGSLRVPLQVWQVPLPKHLGHVLRVPVPESPRTLPDITGIGDGRLTMI